MSRCNPRSSPLHEDRSPVRKVSQHQHPNAAEPRTSLRALCAWYLAGRADDGGRSTRGDMPVSSCWPYPALFPDVSTSPAIRAYADGFNDRLVGLESVPCDKRLQTLVHHARRYGLDVPAAAASERASAATLLARQVLGKVVGLAADASAMHMKPLRRSCVSAQQFAIGRCHGEDHGRDVRDTGT